MFSEGPVRGATLAGDMYCLSSCPDCRAAGGSLPIRFEEPESEEDGMFRDLRRTPAQCEYTTQFQGCESLSLEFRLVNPGFGHSAGLGLCYSQPADPNGAPALPTR